MQKCFPGMLKNVTFVTMNLLTKHKIWLKNYFKTSSHILKSTEPGTGGTSQSSDFFLKKCYETTTRKCKTSDIIPNQQFQPY